MSAKKRWMAAGAGVLLIGVVVAALKPGHSTAPATEAAPGAVASPASGAARPNAAARPGQPPAPGVASALAPGAPPPNAPRAMPYRPAKYLLYSEERPAKHAGADDDAQPVLRRILDLTHADPRQAVSIRDFWHKHEDGRRVLWAQAYPRVSGPRILDPEKLEELDVEFESSVFGVLQPEQKQALSQELPPAGMPHTPPPRLYAVPHFEE